MLKAIRFDLYYLIKQKVFIWCIPLIVAIIFSVNNIKLTQVYSAATKATYSLSFADLTFLFFRGNQAYNPASGEAFQPQALWLFEQLFMCILVCRWGISPRNNVEQSAIIALGKRRFWWTSKCLVAGSEVCIIYLLQYLIFFALAPNHESAFRLSRDLLQRVYSTTINSGAQNNWFVYVMVVPCIVSFLLCLVQRFLSLMIGAFPAGIVVFLYLAATAFSDSPLLVGGLAMPLRSPLCAVKGSTGKWDLIILCCVAVGCLLLGTVRFNKQDLCQAQGRFL